MSIVGQFHLTRKRLGLADITGNGVLKQISCQEKNKIDYLLSIKLTVLKWVQKKWKAGLNKRKSKRGLILETVKHQQVPDDPIVEEHGSLQDGDGENENRWRPASDIKGQSHEIRKEK
jgi:hypothetical protein